jgi:hypothetical protein
VGGYLEMRNPDGEGDITVGKEHPRSAGGAPGMFESSPGVSRGSVAVLPAG